ncbi:oligosaccharide repeat unit polymerase [Gordonia terrae]|uniref:oligosaccharide repeat unit polymerase n=1 Tax=Gordonia terrae TaxID=2055 RepID=UPI00187D0052|nr:oligosaccharide repeat unit polymerase [Gordonia terrae]
MASALGISLGAAILALVVVDGGQRLLYTIFLLEVFLVPIVSILASRISRAELDVASPFVLIPITIGIVFGGAPPLLISAGLDDSAYHVTWALSVGMAAYYIGASLVAVRLGVTLPTMAQRALEVRQLRSSVLYGTFAIGVLAMMTYWMRAGGIPILAADLENARLSALTGSGVPFYLTFLMMVAFWLALSPGSSVPVRVRWILFALTVLLLLSTGWRNTVFAFIVLTLLIRHYTSPIKTRTIMMAGVVAVLGAVAIGLYRVKSSNLINYQTYQLMASSDYVGATQVYLTTYFDAFARNMSTAMAVVPALLPFQNGKTLVWNFLTLFPNGESEPFDFVLKQAAGEGFAGGGLPPTMVGEFYVNFGNTGIFVGMLAVGLVAAICHAMIRSTTSYTAMITGLIGAYYLFVAVRGGLGNVTLTVAWLVLATLIVSRLAGRQPVEHSSQAFSASPPASHGSRVREREEWNVQASS